MVYFCMYVFMQVSVCISRYVFKCMCVHIHIHVDMLIGMGMIVYICIYIYIFLHMSTRIIKLMDVVIIYLINTTTLCLKLTHPYLLFMSL